MGAGFQTVQKKADVIICSTNGQFDLNGPAGKIIWDVAWTEQFSENEKKYSDVTENDAIAAVSGYKMNYKEVYYATLPRWTYGGEKIVTKCVNTCLLKASQYKSIVFPALGTDDLNYPRHLVAETMYECVIQFDLENTSLKEVKFLCYNDETIRSKESDFDEYGHIGYALEPGYTEEELHKMEAAESSRNQDILSNHR
ncbi:unnamed protein product [Mytilus edulis]|uniref:Macro domain-containing protein n=1 Tax=Mytilus edulis TaxID=6550 RepID=A0A8S3TZR7_MYTED|nr:unnamed protein product [Mytilus edulis]